MQDFIKWLESNYNLVMAKLKKNINASEDLEADVVINKRILAPSTALELAEIYEEVLNAVVVLEVYEVELPSDVKADLIRLAKEYLTKLTDLAEVELNNNGNLALCINYVVNKEPVNLGVFNFNNNMISMDFNSAYNEESVQEYL